jgi:hypothetical protein
LVDAGGTEHYLSNPAQQLADCDLLVDLAHRCVPGCVSGSSSPRWVHRQQMKRFSGRGVAVLTHHHEGALVQGRPHFKHQSNWVIFRGGEWLVTSSVTALL